MLPSATSLYGHANNSWLCVSCTYCAEKFRPTPENWSNGVEYEFQDTRARNEIANGTVASHLNGCVLRLRNQRRQTCNTNTELYQLLQDMFHALLSQQNLVFLLNMTIVSKIFMCRQSSQGPNRVPFACRFCLTFSARLVGFRPALCSFCACVAAMMDA